MFHEVRKKSRAMTEAEAKDVFRRTSWGVLAVGDAEGWPYGVPVNYGYADGKFYIHSTSGESHKLDALRQNDKVCLTAVPRHTLLPEKLSTDYESAVAFCRARVVEDAEEKRAAMGKMMEGLLPERAEDAKAHCGGRTDAFVMIELTPLHITGKCRR